MPYLCKSPEHSNLAFAILSSSGNRGRHDLSSHEFAYESKMPTLRLRLGGVHVDRVFRVHPVLSILRRFTGAGYLEKSGGGSSPGKVSGQRGRPASDPPRN